MIHFNLLPMYPTRLNRLLAMVVVYGLLLQGCRSSLPEIVEGSAVEQGYQTTSDHVPSPGQVSDPNVPSSTSSEVPQRSPSTARSAILPFFGAQAWRRYFGEVGTEPPLPSDINQILSSPCPFWSGKSVQDTHLLVLIPSRVSGEPFSLNLLEKLIKRPQDGGYPTAYNFYGSGVRAALGAQAPEGAYWVLMTREVLEGSMDKRYDTQKKLISDHARRTGLAYELPGALEAATVMLSHYVRTGERLYSGSPLTYTRCRELIDNQFPLVLGGFSSGGLGVYYVSGFDYSFCGVSCLRKF
jgi:NLR family CARD domain-containing protein 3